MDRKNPMRSSGVVFRYTVHILAFSKNAFKRIIFSSCVNSSSACMLSSACVVSSATRESSVTVIDVVRPSLRRLMEPCRFIHAATLAASLPFLRPFPLLCQLVPVNLSFLLSDSDGASCETDSEMADPEGATDVISSSWHFPRLEIEEGGGMRAGILVLAS